MNLGEEVTKMDDDRVEELERQVQAMRDWADELEKESPTGAGQFISKEIRDRLAKAAVADVD